MPAIYWTLSGFHLTYEELKLVCVFLCVFLCLFVFILPMRNWNYELTGAYKQIQDMVFILPMRNWNWVWQKSRQIFFLSFSSYLWGIETNSRHPSYTGKISFSSYLWGIETQVRRHRLFSFTTLSFHLTYEELKLSRFSINYISVFAFSSYLWGIETFTKPGTETIWPAVFILPMRNWNFGNCRNPVLPAGFHLTYEELKQGLSFLCRRFEVFSSYLWGIETTNA